MTRLNILQLISSSGFYGAENVTVNLAESLERLGHHAVVGLFANTHRPANDVAEIAVARGISVQTISCDGRIDWNAVRRIRDYIIQHKIDVVHTHGYKADAYALAAARLVRRPLIATCHNWLQSTASLRVYRLFDVLCLRGFDATVAVSAEVAASLRRFGIPAARIAMIANGIDVSRFRSARPTLREEFRKGNGLMVGIVGRLDPDKGQEYLLRAIPEILAAFPETVFVFAGEGPLTTQLKELARQLGSHENVRFVGMRRDMPEFYASMDIIALPSLKEAMPMVVLEAMAAGKPVVATPVGEVPNLISSEKTGLLVKPKDTSTLSLAILRLLSDARLRAKLGSNAEEFVAQHFSSEAMAQQYVSLYMHAAHCS